METLQDILKRYPANGAAAGTSSVVKSEPTPVCEVCGGIGWVRHDVTVDHPDFGRLFACRCQINRFAAGRADRLLRLSRLGNLEGVTFEALGARASGGSPGANAAMLTAIEVAKKFAAEPKGWLVIEGPAGSGKTRLAAAVVHASIAGGTPTLFLPVPDLLDHLRAAFAPDSEIPYDELFEQVRNIRLLMLDDLGTESATPWAREKLWQLLSHRYNAGLPTVITTDVPLDQHEDRVRARLMDRSLTKVVRLAATAHRAGHGIDQLDMVLPHLTFQNFNPDGMGLKGQFCDNLREAYRLAQSFAEHPEGWLVLTGQHGCGKTHLSAAISNVCREKGQDVLFLLVPKLLDYLRAAVNQPGGPSFEALDRAERAGLLVLDDFGQVGETPWARDKMDQLLNYRSLTRAATVITSSLRPEEMEPRIWSRMSDPRMSNVYEILAPDYRTGRAGSPTREAPSERQPRGRGRRPQS
ncbi:MAG: ATP-binding protein [Chloroflexi bacterium]|nr:ATP-binding protein [Chloroflexota bacterium]